MRPLPSPNVQLVTGSWRDTNDLEARVVAALRGGIRWVQLRDKSRSAHELWEAATRLAPLLREAGALFVVNDRIDVALSVGAGGVHLPEHGMVPRQARELLGADAWIARSVHSLDAVRAASADLDALQFGPVFETASKRKYGSPQGLSVLQRAAEATPLHVPLIAVGGITPANASDCRSRGAAAVSVIGSIWDADDVESAAQRWVLEQGVALDS